MMKSKELLGKMSVPGKLLLVVLLAVVGVIASFMISGPTTVMTPEGVSASSGVHHTGDSQALADEDEGNNTPSKDATTDPKTGLTTRDDGTGIQEVKTIELKACPELSDSFDNLPDTIKNSSKREKCTDEEQKLWSAMVEAGGGTPRSEQIRLANTGSLLTAINYLPTVRWTTNLNGGIGTFKTAPDLKDKQSLLRGVSMLYGFMGGLVITVGALAWTFLTFLVALAFSADIASRGIHFVDFMVAWFGSLLTSSGGAISILGLVLVCSLVAQLIRMVLPTGKGNLIGTRAGNARAMGGVRSAVSNAVIGFVFFVGFIFISHQATKNHVLSSDGVAEYVDSSQRSAIGKYATKEMAEGEAVAQDIAKGSGVDIEVRNNLRVDLPVSALKEPDNWATLSPGWMMGNMFKFIHWATAKVVEIPLVLAQATNESNAVAGDSGVCTTYIDGKRGLFLATPAAKTYNLGADLLTSLDILFERLVIDPYVSAAFGPGSSGQSAYCRVMESGSGTTTGEQILAMRASGLYGKIVGLGGMGTIGGEGSSDIIAPGNPWKKISIQPKGGTLLDEAGYPVMLGEYGGYKKREGSNDDDDCGYNPLCYGKKGLSAVGNSVKAVGNAINNTAQAFTDPTKVLMNALGTKETVDDGTKRSAGGELHDKTDSANGPNLSYDASMKALQRVFGPGAVHSDAEFETLAYFAACRPIVGTDEMKIARSWEGAEKAEPLEGAGELTVSDCLKDSIIGPYTNGGFGGGSESEEESVEASSDQKAWLYKPRDSDNEKTTFMGFSVSGDDTNDNSAISKLSKARGSALYGGEALGFYERAASGNITIAVTFSALVVLGSVWVAYKYLLKIILGALFAGFILIGASFGFFMGIAGMIVPTDATRKFFRTSFFATFSSGAASALVSVALVSLVALSRIFEFMFLGGIGYLLGGMGGAYAWFEPLMIFATVIAASMLVEKAFGKLMGGKGPKISNWGAVSALSGMAAQPLRHAMDPQSEPLFSNWNREGAEEWFKDTKGKLKGKDKPEVLSDDDVDPEESALDDALNDEDDTTEDTASDNDTTEDESRDEGQDRVDEAKGGASPLGNSLPDVEATKATLDVDDDDDFERYANAYGASPFGGLFNPFGSHDDDDDDTPTSGLGGTRGSDQQRDHHVPPAADDTVTSYNEPPANPSEPPMPSKPARNQVGENGWNGNVPEVDLSSVDAVYQEAIAQMSAQYQGAAQQMASNFADAVARQGESLSRMAGEVQFNDTGQNAIREAVSSYNRQANNLSEQIAVETGNGIKAMLSPDVVNNAISQASANAHTMQQVMESQMGPALSRSLAVFHEEVGRSIAKETARGVEQSIPDISASASRPIAAEMTRAITEEITRNMGRK